MRILCLQGSLGEPSRTASLLVLAQRLLTRLGAEVDVCDLRTQSFPHVDPRHHGGERHPDPAVRALRERAVAADAFVLASPVYHNSYSGVLKAALDHLSIGELADKPVALCGNGGRTGSTQPVDHLRIVVRGLHGVAIPRTVVTRNADFRWVDGQYRIAERALVARAQQVCQQLVAYAAALAPLRSAESAAALSSVTADQAPASG